MNTIHGLILNVNRLFKFNDSIEVSSPAHNKLERKQVIGVINKMNELYEEKESWRKSWIEELNDSEEQSKCILKLANENEELKKEIQNLQAKLNILEQAITGDKKQ